MFKRLRAQIHSKQEKQRRSITSSPEPSLSSEQTLTLDNEETYTGRSPSQDASTEAPESSLDSGHSTRDATRSPSDGLLTDTLGLKVIYQPPSVAPLDIVFVHGLGGASCRTWSKYRDPNLFWPQRWLPHEPHICKARIFTFGYKADFGLGSQRSIANVTDFAKELLFAMKFAQDEANEDLRVGKVPVIFVAHSMGGLIVKQAYVLGQIDGNYDDIVQSISAIVFLSTPHRGTHLAEILNRILSISFQSTKNFIGDINRSSAAIENLNEQFRHLATKLDIVSFYETLHTSIGPKKMLVVEKDCSILGYPHEISAPLNADHHDVCKYSSQDDPNYISVRSALTDLVRRFGSKGANALNSLKDEDERDLRSLFALSQAPDDDLDYFRKRWMPGSCQWILSEPALKTWTEFSPESRIAWLCAPPGTGKSILATHIIKHLQGLGFGCHYFFFRFGDQSKRSLGVLLRSLGYQSACGLTQFRRAMVELSREGLKLEKMDPRVVWQKIFISVLFKLAQLRPIYWVIDALDEADSPKAFLELLQDVSRSTCPIRVFIISRDTEQISMAFKRLSRSISVDIIGDVDPENTQADMRLYVQKELEFMRGRQDLKSSVLENILARADGNFLWVRLVLEEVQHCRTETAIRDALQDIPNGMTALYSRMENGIANNPRPSDRHWAKTFLKWTICARRALSLTELAEALEPESLEFLDLKSTIQDVCRQFIVIDRNMRITIVHQTARDYLTKTQGLKFSIDVRESHTEIFSRTILAFADNAVRSKLRQRISQDDTCFLHYAATSWAYHLRHSATVSNVCLELLVRFFKGPSVMTWIHALAVYRRLDTLVTAANALSSFIGQFRRLNATRNPLLHRLQDLEILDLWAIDLVRIVGKFSRHLIQDPASIHKTVPQFCPKESAIYRQRFHIEKSSISVSGISNDTWSDCLAKITLQRDEQAEKILCAGPYFAVVSLVGVIYVWGSSSFEKLSILPHAESITSACFSAKCDKILTCGLRTTKLWALPSGHLLASFENPTDTKLLAVIFTDDDTRILSAADDKIIRRLLPNTTSKGWEQVSSALAAEQFQIEGGFLNIPTVMSFSPDAAQVAIAYRGYPLSVWTTNESQLVGRCKRTVEGRPGTGRPSAQWMAVERVVWHPTGTHVLGLYKDGSIFKWDPIGDESQEARATADEIGVSPDGKLFITSDGDGTIKIWNMTYFSVVYQLYSEDPVIDLAFSPDCRRFYDLRWSSLNIWEPNSLVRLAEAEESASDSASEQMAPPPSSHVSEAKVASVDPICALVAAPHSLLYCAANEDGAVTLFESSTLRSVQVAKVPSFRTVEHLDWVEEGDHIAMADLGGNIMVQRIDWSAARAVESETKMVPVLKATVDRGVGGIHQVLLDPNSEKLLVVGESSCQVWSIENGCVLAASTIQSEVTRKWLNHPLQRDLLLSFGPSNVKAIRWKDLSQVAHLELQSGVPEIRLDPVIAVPDLARLLITEDIKPRVEASVNKAFLTHDGQDLLLQILERSAQGKTAKRLRIINVSSLQISDAGDWSQPLSTLDIPEEISLRIEVPLGIVSGRRLVFLDNDLWMCTFKLDTLHGSNTVNRHFFLPFDWASTEASAQCCLLEDGTLLFPRDGEVAVISSGLARGDW